MTLALALAALLLYRNWLGPAGFHFLLYRWRPALFARAKNQTELPTPAQLAFEKRMTFVHFLCDLATLALIVLLARSGLTRFYDSLDERGWAYALGSFALLFFVQDAWFYFTHRLLHWGPLYRHVHAVHHRAKNTNPWSAWCVHPVENAIEAGLWPLVALMLPLHPLVLVAYLFVSAFLVFNGHSGYEFNPTNFAGVRALNAWLGTATCHNLHHAKNRVHYGFYFRIWDRLLGTEDPAYEATLRSMATRPHFSSK